MKGQYVSKEKIKKNWQCVEFVEKNSRWKCIIRKHISGKKQAYGIDWIINENIHIVTFKLSEFLCNLYYVLNNVD